MLEALLMEFIRLAFFIISGLHKSISRMRDLK